MVDAHAAQLVDALRRQRVAVGVDAQLGVGQLAPDHLEPVHDLRIDERLAVQERLDGGQRKLGAVLDDLLEECLVHVRLLARPHVVRTERALGVASTGGLDGNQTGVLAVIRCTPSIEHFVFSLDVVIRAAWGRNASTLFPERDMNCRLSQLSAGLPATSSRASGRYAPRRRRPRGRSGRARTPTCAGSSRAGTASSS